VRLVCFGDIHIALGAIDRLAPVLAAADAAILLGDLTNFGDPPDAARVLGAVRAHCPLVFAVTGNLDFVWRDDLGSRSRQTPAQHIRVGTVLA